MKTRSLHDIVKNLTGPISPVGSEHIDGQRLASLEETCLLVDKLLYDISMVAELFEQHQASVKRCANCAKRFLEDVKDNI